MSHFGLQRGYTRRKTYTAEVIINKLREIEVLIGQGASMGGVRMTCLQG